MAKPITVVSFDVKVYGIGWFNSKVSTEYHFDNIQPTREQIAEKCGDFQEVTHMRMLKRTVTIERVKIPKARCDNEQNF